MIPIIVDLFCFCLCKMGIIIAMILVVISGSILHRQDESRNVFDCFIRTYSNTSIQQDYNKYYYTFHLSITNSSRHSEIHHKIAILHYSGVIQAVFRGVLQLGNLKILSHCMFVNVVKDIKLLLCYSSFEIHMRNHTLTKYL